MTEFSALPFAELPQDAIEVGRIGEAWGVKGWFKVIPFSSAPEALLSASHWYLLPAQRGAKSPFERCVGFSVQQARPHGDAVVAQAQGVQDRAQAELLRGARIFIPRSAFPQTQDDEYYWVDLIGLAVANREGVQLGTVRDLLASGPQTTLVLAGEQGGKPCERLVPFVSAFVDQVDLAGRRITVDWQPDY